MQPGLNLNRKGLGLGTLLSQALVDDLADLGSNDDKPFKLTKRFLPASVQSFRELCAISALSALLCSPLPI